MKNRLLFPIIFAFIFSACSNFSGNEDEVEASLKPSTVTAQKEEETATTRTYYDLYGITFGNNTFVAVGKKGTVRYSSDNGSSWDNGTSGTTKYLYEIAYGDSTFVTVGQSGTIRTSSDNGTTWSTGTTLETSTYEGVAYGNILLADNTTHKAFVALGSSNVWKSIDSGSNWNQITTANLNDVAFGNSIFIGCGDDGAIETSDNGSNPWSSVTSGASEDLNGITYGNNRFISVGDDGKLIKSTDNGSTWGDVNSGVLNSYDLESIAYGNNKFVGVGYKTVIVSSDNNSTGYTLTDTTLTFNDVTYGNGIFVAVGADEIIYTSADGDRWTKVHGK